MALGNWRLLVLALGFGSSQAAHNAAVSTRAPRPLPSSLATLGRASTGNTPRQSTPATPVGQPSRPAPPHNQRHLAAETLTPGKALALVVTSVGAAINFSGLMLAETVAAYVLAKTPSGAAEVTFSR